MLTEQIIQVNTVNVVNLHISCIKCGPVSLPFCIALYFLGKTERMNAYSSTCGVKGGRNKSNTI